MINMRKQHKNVPFRLSEDIHTSFKSYCALQKISMQGFLEKIVELAIEKNLPAQAIFDGINKLDNRTRNND